VTVHVDRRGRVVLLTLDRPAKRNAFDGDLTQALDTALNDFMDDPTAAVAVLAGGRDVYSAGTDLQLTAGESTARGGPYGITARDLTKPVIAAVEGVSAGGGTEVVLAATMVVASTSAHFSLPEVGLGLVAECGGLFRGSRSLPLNVARELLLTGDRLTAERAYMLGLVNQLVKPGEAVQAALALAERVARHAPLAVEQTLRAVDAMFSAADEVGWSVTATARDITRGSADATEGIAAFFERRPPRWTGA